MNIKAGVGNPGKANKSRLHFFKNATDTSQHLPSAL